MVMLHDRIKTIYNKVFPFSLKNKQNLVLFKKNKKPRFLFKKNKKPRWVVFFDKTQVFLNPDKFIPVS